MPRKTVKKRTKGSDKKKQNGGERHKEVIRKEGKAISFPNGFPELSTPGDYDLIHAYDSEQKKLETLKKKSEQLNTWLTSTFPLSAANPNQTDAQSNQPISLARKLFDSAYKTEFLALVDWLLNGEL
jgi:hypothetical protein